MQEPDQFSFVFNSKDDFSPGCPGVNGRLLPYPSSKRRSWAWRLGLLFGCIRYAAEDDYRLGLSDTINLDMYLPPKLPNSRRRTLILDLDETLVHSSFVPVQDYDILVPVDITGQLQNVYVKKRPHVDEFLVRVEHFYEVVIFTASLPMYSNPVISKLDQYGVVSHRLFRQHCVRTETGYVKDLSFLGRNLDDTIIVDNCPSSYSRQPHNSVPISSWFGDSESDNVLIDTVLPILEEIANHKGSVYDCTRRLSASSMSSTWSRGREGQTMFVGDADDIIASMLPVPGNRARNKQNS